MSHEFDWKNNQYYPGIYQSIKLNIWAMDNVWVML